MFGGSRSLLDVRRNKGLRALKGNKNVEKISISVPQKALNSLYSESGIPSGDETIKKQAQHFSL